MQSVLKRLSNKLDLVMDVFAIGQALETGRLTAAQATSALDRAGHRSDLRQLDTDHLTGAGVVRRHDDLVDAR